MPDMMDGMSMNLEQTNMDKLRAVFPECFVEGRLDIDKLLSLCGEYISNDFEKYKFEWKGKAECLKLAQKRSTGTLRPCPEESVNWDTTQNLYIEGDNLEVLKLLQTTYYRKVKMIYIDPPYNTGNDFVYQDDFADPMARYKEVTQQTTKSNPETMGRFHTNWLNMMYPRLRLAANLLKDDGLVFISVDNNEMHNLRKLCDEVFGEENFVECIIWKKRYGGGPKERYLVNLQEYIFVYCKNKSVLPDLFVPLSQESIERYYSKRDEYYESKGPYRTQPLEAAKSLDSRENLIYPIPAPDGTEIWPKRQWLWSRERAYEALANDGLVINQGSDGKWYVAIKQYLYDDSGETRQTKMPSIIEEIYTQHGSKEIECILGGAKVFSYPKPSELIKKLIQVGMGKDDIILDFFSGSATTAHAVMKINAEDGGQRKYILVQLPEMCEEDSDAYKAGYKNICEIGKERIRRSGKELEDGLKDSGLLLRAMAKYKNEQGTMDGFTYSEWGETPEVISAKEKMANALDIGFRVYKLDTSNLKTWDTTPIRYEQVGLLYDRMNDMVQRVKPDRSDMDMVCEIMIKLGVPLTYSITPVDLGGKAAYMVGDDCLLMVCLANDIQPEDVEAMADYAPAKIVISRESFADDSAMANAYYILKDREIELKLV